MTEDRLSELRSGFETAFIDGTVASNLAYKPQFISNNYKQGKKVLLHSSYSFSCSSLSLVFSLDCLSLAASLFATTLMAMRVSISSSSTSSIALAESFVCAISLNLIFRLAFCLSNFLSSEPRCFSGLFENFLKNFFELGSLLLSF